MKPKSSHFAHLTAKHGPDQAPDRERGEHETDLGCGCVAQQLQVQQCGTKDSVVQALRTPNSLEIQTNSVCASSENSGELKCFFPWKTKMYECVSWCLTHPSEHLEEHDDCGEDLGTGPWPPEKGEPTALLVSLSSVVPICLAPLIRRASADQTFYLQLVFQGARHSSSHSQCVAFLLYGEVHRSPRASCKVQKGSLSFSRRIKWMLAVRRRELLAVVLVERWIRLSQIKVVQQQFRGQTTLSY